MNKAQECVIVCQQSVDCGAWPNGACEQWCAQAERAQAGDGLPPLPEPRHRGPDGTGSYFDAYTADQMRAYALAARGAHGHEFEVWQDGAPVASSWAADRRKAMDEALHYANQYGQDGPVSIYCVRRELVTGEEQR